MDKYTKEELAEALRVISLTISKCEKIQPKFVGCTSQHTLLKNRIKAMYISKLLVKGESIMDKYTKGELLEALPPISSVISKCEKAQLKYVDGTFYHTRFKNIIKPMNISKSLITNEISRRG